jgi:hypothetical protein
VTFIRVFSAFCARKSYGQYATLPTTARKNDVAAYKKMCFLRRDFQNVLDVCKNMQKREELKYQ